VVTDDSGRVLALCRQHGRWVNAAPVPAAPEARPAPSWPQPGRAGFTEVLGIPAAADGGAHLDLPVTSDVVNPLADLHGGIALWVCELVAQAAAGSNGGRWHTASIRVAYPRPLPLGTVASFEGRVLHRGRTFAVTQVTASNGSGKPCVLATVTMGAPGTAEGRPAQFTGQRGHR
jgi:uncharacterized protein (TIGR00369 family)